MDCDGVYNIAAIYMSIGASNIGILDSEVYVEHQNIRPNHGRLNVDDDLCANSVCSQRSHDFAETIDAQTIGGYVTSWGLSSIRPSQRGHLQHIVDDSVQNDHFCTATSRARP